LIKFSKYIGPNPPTPNIWGKSGHRLYPVHDTTLEELGIDPDALPPFQRPPPSNHPVALSDAQTPLFVPLVQGRDDVRRRQTSPRGAQRGTTPPRGSLNCLSSSTVSPTVPARSSRWRGTSVAYRDDRRRHLGNGRDRPREAGARSLQAGNLASRQGAGQHRVGLRVEDGTVYRSGPPAIVLVDGMLRLPMFEIVPPGAAGVEAAFGAFVVFGRGSGHPAALNLGDLFSYALAKVRALPLLFKGNDFSETDIVPAVSVAPE
jgi:uncharacterized protein with PIN domain